MLIADYGKHQLLPQEQFAGFQRRSDDPDSIGHHAEWFRACKTGTPTTCNFDYSGTLAEAVLLGNVATAWPEAPVGPCQLKATGCPQPILSSASLPRRLEGVSSRARNTPSPRTPGEGRGEGLHEP